MRMGPIEYTNVQLGVVLAELVCWLCVLYEAQCFYLGLSVSNSPPETCLEDRAYPSQQESYAVVVLTPFIPAPGSDRLM